MAEPVLLKRVDGPGWSLLLERDEQGDYLIHASEPGSARTFEEPTRGRETPLDAAFRRFRAEAAARAATCAPRPEAD